MKYENSLTNKIYETLAPLIGAYMAVSAIEIQCKKLGKPERLLDKNDLPKIAVEIKKSLIVFLGSDNAQKISDKIGKMDV